MTTPQLRVAVGEQQTATVIEQDGLYALVRLGASETAPPVIVCLRIGAVDPVSGYEAAAARLLEDRLQPGQQVRITWLGNDTDGIAMAQVSDHGGSVERALLTAGVATANAHGKAVSAVAVSYQTALMDAARANRGAWADESSGIAEMTRAWSPQTQMVLRPTFVSAHPSFCLVVALVVAGVVSYVMYRENTAVDAELDSDQAGTLQRVATRALNTHLRFFRFDPFRSFRQRPVPEAKPTVQQQEPQA